MENKLGDVKFYKVKGAKRDFLCALCESPRQMKYSRKLSTKHYIQIAVLSAVCSWLLFPVMGYKVTYLFFINWLMFEVAHKVLYRKELPCPYCGFDATWYRRDVKVARKLVAAFWDKKEGNVATREEIAPVA